MEVECLKCLDQEIPEQFVSAHFMTKVLCHSHYIEWIKASIVDYIPHKNSECLECLGQEIPEDYHLKHSMVSVLCFEHYMELFKASIREPSQRPLTSHSQ